MNRRRILKLLLPLTILALLASGVFAQADFTFVDGYEALCSEGTPARIWQDGDTLQIRGQVNTYATYVPAYQEPVGQNTAIVNVTVDVNTGDGVVWGTFASMPGEFDGAWEGNYSGRLTGWLYSGRGIGHGTGALDGQQMKTVTEEITYDPALMPTGLCPSGNDPPTMLHNEIRTLSPHGE